MSKDKPKEKQGDKSPQPQAGNESAQTAAAPAAAQASEKKGILRFFREMGAALGMALIAIVYVIQAFQIPTGSMENSLLVGDFLLGLKFVYGASVVPFSQDLGVKARLPAITDPKRGDIIIFKYPGADKKDYIKRMVAGPGDVVQVVGNRALIINGTEVKLPPKGKHTPGASPHPRIADFAPLYIPAKGDVLVPDTMPVREFMFLRILAGQEHPTKRVRMHFDLYVDGEPANNAPLDFNGARISMNDLQGGQLTFRNEMTRRTEAFDFNMFDDWTILEYFLEVIKRNFAGRDVELRQKLYIGDERVEKYAVQFDNYFMMGDNRDNSLDSRYWGYLNRNFVKAKAFILYFSLDKDEPLWKLPFAIRWGRIGKLIRDWDGIEEPKDGIKY